MKNKLQLILIVLTLSLAIFGCRKEDATPYYNYFGGTGGDSSLDEGAEGTAEAPANNLEPVVYEKLYWKKGCDIASIKPESGFIDSEEDFASKWKQWCPDVEAPTVNFKSQIVIYYFAQPMPCEKIEFKGVEKEGENLNINIEKQVLTSKEGEEKCVCILLFKKALFLYTVERTDGTPKFNEAIVEVPCNNNQ